MSTPHVRGPSAYNRPASPLIEAAAVLADLGITLLLWALAFRILGAAPLPRALWPLWYFVSFLALWLAQRRWLHLTLGDRLWQLQPDARTSSTGRALSFRLFQHQAPGPSTLATGILLTLAPWTAALLLIKGIYAHDPRFATSAVWRIEPFLPQATESSPTRWQIVPFFYTLGAWPSMIEGAPVLYSLPYEKGPPDKFLGHIHARWKFPSVQVTLEGPKTPLTPANVPLGRETIRECLLRAGFRCLQARDLVLSRHLTEMSAGALRAWQVRWFEVQNPAIPAGEQAQGIFVAGRNDARLEARFVLITAKGTHQSLILTAPADESGEAAQALLEKVIGSLRISDDLTPGKIWIDREIQSIRLDQVTALDDPAAQLAKLAQIEATLLAKLSVDPKTFDTYYHLAGTALLLLKNGVAAQASDRTAVAEELIRNILRYGEDVPPRDASQRTRLQNLGFEANKLLKK